MPEADPSPDPKPAPRLGSYTLVQALGSGGMSNVFRAVHEESGNVVAVKVLPRTLAKNPTLLQRFMREAKSAEALDHPNIVAIYDRGFDQGRHYLVLEFVEGKDMHDRVRLNGPLAPDAAARFVREVAEGLRYAAGQGMIHRDVKPANLLMDKAGRAKVIDLGLALQIDDEDERVTRDGTTVGTVDYMAPEQARDSRQTSERSDIYSLGCTFYYLLTGSPPFPGGGLSDKLARHYKAPIPDVREQRPEIPESLSLLIRKMMEKKPENRFVDYDRLIEALDDFDNPSTQNSTEPPLDALIVDDEDDDDEIGLVPTEPALVRDRQVRPPSALEAPLMAEIVDDDDDEDEDDEPGPTLPPPGPRPAGREVPARAKAPATAAPPELSLADLAGLDSDDPPPRRPPSKGAQSTANRPASNPSQSARRPTPASAPAIIDDDEDEDEEIYGDGGNVRRSPGAELPLKTWISAGVMVGLSIAIVAFGATMLLSPDKSEPEPDPDSIARKYSGSSTNPPEETDSPTPTPRASGPRGPEPKKPRDDKKKPVEKVQTADVATPVVPTVEPTYPKEWAAKFAPPPATRTTAQADPKARCVVRRISVGGDEAQFPTIAAAFSRSNDLVEIADVGPFFEDDLQVAGKSRLIRAREGIRPMIKVEFAENETVKDQVAKFVLGNGRVEHLVFEGIDFAVDVRDLPDHQACLFLCQGADLTFRDCSLTVLNGSDAARPVRFSLIRVEDGAAANRLVFERTLLRGPVGSLVKVVASRAEVVFSRSMVLGDNAPLIQAEPVDKPARSFYFDRSFLATRGTVLEFVSRNHPTVIRSLGTVFAKVDGGANPSAGAFASRAAIGGEPASAVDWAGEDNDFIGWPAWLTDGSVRVAGLDAVKSSWPGSDGTSRESATPWQGHVRPESARAIEFAQLAPWRKPTLLKIASPHPWFRDLTFGSLGRMPTPELSADLMPKPIPAARPGGMDNQLGIVPKPVAVPAPQTGPVAGANGPRPKGGLGQKSGPTPKKGAVAFQPGPGGPGVPPPPPGPLKLTFDVRESPWLGDLGLYLREKLVKGTAQAVVAIKGTGVFSTTPIRFDDGLSIAILGEPVQPLVTFKPKLGSAGQSMFEMHGGDLALANLGFSSEGTIRPKHWVLAEDSILAIKHCWFRDPTPGGASAGVAPLIAFLAKGTAPIPKRAGPLVSETDRPTARFKDTLLWTTGDAVTAAVGRGVVDLDNCMIISGGPAFTLQPGDVGRDRFEADLVLNYCTVATDKTSLLLGPMPGEPIGPARPWLVSTRKCAFPRVQPAGGAGALLQVDADAMARGVLFWQSSYDAYDSLHLLVATGPQVANPPSNDVKKQWIDIWGVEHTKGDQGPTARRNETVLRYMDREKPKPGKIVPTALDIDKSVLDCGVAFKELPTPTSARLSAESQAGRGVFGPRPDRN